MKNKYEESFSKLLYDKISLEIFNNDGLLFLVDNYFLNNRTFYNILYKQFENFKPIIMGNISTNPDILDILKLKKDLADKDFDLIVALGGGSVIDTAKAISCFNKMEFKDIEKLRNNIIEKKYLKNNPNIPIIAIPTTAGTGSEVTAWATLWDKDKGKKYSIEKDDLIPKDVILEPELTVSLPLNITVSTALDALSHAVEAYWSKKTNAEVRENALKAISLISNNLFELLGDLSNLKLREKMLKGSYYAGFAFSKTKTTSCHSISYPLTMKYNIPHGIAVSMTLINMLNLNKKALINVDDFLNAFNVKSIDEIDKWIKKIYDIANIKYKLKDYGVSFSELESLADECFTPGRMDNNPVELSKEDVYNVLKNIY